MKRHVVVTLLMAVVLLVNCLPVYAAAGFDGSVLKNAPDITTSTYEETGTAYTISSLKGESFFSPDKDFLLQFEVGVLQDDVAEGYVLSVSYGSYTYALNVQEIKVDIGDKVYIFSKPISRMSVIGTEGQAIVKETTTIIIAENSLPFMQELIAHRDEVIKVSLIGVADQNIDFELPKSVKDSAIHMYNLYVQAGGTRAENLAYLKGTEIRTEKRVG